MTWHPSRIAAFILGLVFIAFGFLCLNYTKAFDFDHHSKWAEEQGLPAPTYAIFLSGAILEALGAGVAGVAVGRSSSRVKANAA